MRKKPSLQQIVCMRDMLALGKTFENLAFDGEYVTFTNPGTGDSCRITYQGSVYKQETAWVFVQDRRGYAMEAERR